MATPLRRYMLQGGVWQIPGQSGLADPTPVTPPTPTTPGVYTLLDSNFDAATISNPIVPADMWAAVGQKLGDAGTFQRTSVVAVSGRGNVLNQFYKAGEFGTGFDTVNHKAGLSMFPKLARPVSEASISFDVRISGDFGWGGKLPGLGGKHPTIGGNPPTGGTASPFGWSGRLMWYAPGAGYGTQINPPAEFAAYAYLPTQPTTSYGQERWTNVTLALGVWQNVRQYYKMNTVTQDATIVTAADGTKSASGGTYLADGIHRVYVNDVLAYESTNTVFTRFAAAKVTHLAWSMFYGGATVDWAPKVDSNHQLDNILITTPQAA